MNVINPTLISVVVPIGGKNPSSQFIEQWLPSIDFAKFQIILVQDNLKSFVALELNEILNGLNVIQKDRLIVENVNYENIGKSRNAGLRRATGDWIAFWDSDDIPQPNKFSEMIDSVEESNVDLVVGQFHKKSTDSETVLKSNTSSLTNLVLDPGIWRMAFRRSVVEDNDFPSYSMGEDQVFIFRSLQSVKNIEWVETFVYTYRTGNPSQITKQKVKLNDLMLALEDFLKLEARGKLLKSTILQASLNIMMTIIINGTRRQKIKGMTALCAILVREHCVDEFSKTITNKLVARRMTRVPNLVISLAGGLGNQLFQYAAALNHDSTAKILFERRFGGPRQNQSGLPEIFSFQNSWLLLGDDEPTSWIPQKIYNSLIRTSGTNKNWLFSVIGLPMRAFFSLILRRRLGCWLNVSLSRGLGGEATPTLPIDTYQIGLFQNSENCLHPNVLKSLRELQPTNPSTELVEWINRAKNQRILVVHVRLGDYLLEPDFGIPSPEYYFEAIAGMQALDDFSDIWVFSNDIEKAKEHLSFLNFDFVTWVPEIGGSASETLHLMREGSAFVIANSTFSWWGAFLSKTEDAQVVAPSPWFVRATAPEGIIPVGWRTINPWNLQSNATQRTFDSSKLGKFGRANLGGMNVI